jgi:hypothetical protein
MIARYRNTFIVGGLCVAGLLIAWSYNATGQNQNDQNQGIIAVQDATSTSSGTLYSTTTSYINQASSTDSEQLNATDAIARSLFSKLIQAKQLSSLSGLSSDNSQPLDSNTQQALIQEMATEQNQIIKPTVHIASEFYVDNQETSDSIDTYGNILGSVILADGAHNSKSEIELFNNAVLDNSQTEITQLDPIIASYKSIIADSMRVEVPASAMQAHLDYVNSLEEVLSSIKGMRLYFTDPASAFAGLQVYQKSVTDLHSAIQELGGYFNRKGIIYGDNEYGYIFTKNI